MKLTKKGKKSLSQYVDKLEELRKSVLQTTPLNKFLLSQIESLQNITGKLADAWDATFEMSLFNNASEYLKNYNIVNNGDGSWAIALSDGNSRKLATLTKNLFEEFKNNLHEYIDGLPKDAKEITIFGIRIAYSNPQAIFDSAICQIQGAIQFYDYLGTENSLKLFQKEITDQIPYDSYDKSPLPNKQIVDLIQTTCKIPSSFLRNSENRDDNNVVKVMPTSSTGALGYLCQLSLNYYLESYAVAEKKEEPIVLANSMQTGKVLTDLIAKLNDFTIFANNFADEKHADYKQIIIADLKKIVSEQLKVLATKERLECFYTTTYSDMYIAGKKLELYCQKNQLAKIDQQKEITLAAIKSYIDELKHIVPLEAVQPIESYLTKLAMKKDISKDDICDVIVRIDREIIREKFAIPPTMVIHKLIKELSRLNLEHVELVKANNHTLGGTGDTLNDLYSYLLTSFTNLTLAEEPITLIQFKLIDNLIKAMAKELAPVEKVKTNNVIAMKVSGGSPLHNDITTAKDNQTNETELVISKKGQGKRF